MAQKIVVGLMSGTSLDGIDAAVVKISETDNQEIKIKLIRFTTLPYSESMRERILALCDPDRSRLEDISLSNMLLGELFAKATKKVITEAGLEMKDVDLISSHGQTIFHQPEGRQVEGYNLRSTLQIGDIAVIAERTGIMTVGDFRTRDMAVGGQGAPLVPYADDLLFRENSKGRILANIGGIANLTVLPPAESNEQVHAFDTGPGNMLIDAFTTWATNGKQTFDKNGEIAAKGKIDEKWLEELLDHDYYRLLAPKSTGREQFGLDYAKDLWNKKADLAPEDKIATITELTARTIADECKRFVDSYKINEVIISGGGWYNQTLRRKLQAHLPPSYKLGSTDELGIPADAKEAIVFALLGYQCINKRPNNLPSATGAKSPVIMGKIALAYK
ncbi:anhydro-N-acetylmuramic acid kinase [Bacillus sp. REN16]|uniref:anhydro-N-acetylmuramic acid kinase n=1 Tax=Bacillus sp. REN16 TaxID=2887296 RepID=UPI001E2A97B8|nr:anhydro-N-acetylmuramic acid kinase [Bacillus sp. REN16]MCC3356357.1 anhydro-N-acetylmuramic acid kinase [Bacillus sp. REN16]